MRALELKSFVSWQPSIRSIKKLGRERRGRAGLGRAARPQPAGSGRVISGQRRRAPPLRPLRPSAPSPGTRLRARGGSCPPNDIIVAAVRVLPPLRFGRRPEAALVDRKDSRP